MTDAKATGRTVADDLRDEVAQQPRERTERQAATFNARVDKLKASGLDARAALSQAVADDPRGHAASICPTIQPGRVETGLTKAEPTAAAKRFAELVNRLEKGGMSRREAISKAVREDPEGHAEYIRAAQWTSAEPKQPTAKTSDTRASARTPQVQESADATASTQARAGEPSEASAAPKTSTATVPAARDRTPGTRINYKVTAHIRALSSGGSNQGAMLC